jgi:hypothetical protein
MKTTGTVTRIDENERTFEVKNETGSHLVWLPTEPTMNMPDAMTPDSPLWPETGSQVELELVGKRPHPTGQHDDGELYRVTVNFGD